MENIYDKYYWQNDKVRLRAVSLEDDNYNEKLDSEAWAMANEEMALPPAITEKNNNEKTELPTDKAIAFSVEDLDGNYIGDARYNDINQRHGTFEIGISIWKNYRNKGYGKAAVMMLLKYAFNELRLNKCNVDCIDCNNGTIALMKSLKFKQEGIIRANIFYNGFYHSKLLFGLTADEYRSLFAESA